MSNLEFMVQLERLFNEIGSGGVSMEVVLHNASAKGVRVYGSKKLLYNRSNADTQNNDQAFKDIIARILEGLNGDKQKISFDITTNDRKITAVEWKSQIDKRFRA